jgi:hypothetical protein
MFSTYPDEWPGTGLVVLRVVIGSVLIVRGSSFLADRHDLELVPAASLVLSLVDGATPTRRPVLASARRVTGKKGASSYKAIT